MTHSIYLNMKKHIYGFLFDLDGVLIDSETEYTKIWSLINEEFPTGVPSFEYVIKGSTLERILDKYYPDNDIKEKVVARLYELEAKMSYSFLPGARQLLEKLKARNYPAAMVTSSNDDKMRHLYQEIPDIGNYFNSIVTADLITKSKPDPEGYLLGANLIGVDIKDCAVFEDSLQGVKAGRESGAFVVGITGTLGNDVIAPWCDILVRDLSEISLDNLISLMEKRNSL